MSRCVLLLLASVMLRARSVRLPRLFSRATALGSSSTGYRQRDTGVDEVVIRGQTVLVKRDDQLRLLESGVFGNKARKLWWLNGLSAQDFPSSIASHGGPQSNAMVAVAAVAHKHRLARKQAAASESRSSDDSSSVEECSADGAPTFHYFLKTLPRWLRSYPSGNFLRAKALGMTIHELSPQEYAKTFGGKAGSNREMPRTLESRLPASTVWIPQGGAMVEAEPGLKILAKEIESYWNATSAEDEWLVLAVPAGTGTTALYIARHIQHERIRVVALACCAPSRAVGSHLTRLLLTSQGTAEYTEAQIQALDRVTVAGRATADKSDHRTPWVLGGQQNVPFGEPREELLSIWTELQDAGVYCDLVYAPRAWQILFEHWDEETLRPPNGRLMYLHTGGLEGVSSQLSRYKRQGLLDSSEMTDEFKAKLSVETDD